MAISSEQKKALDKMLKMMAIVNDERAPEGERQAAQSQIDKIMAKYGLTMSDMKTSDIEVNFEFYMEDEKENAYVNSPAWMTLLYHKIFKMHGCLMVREKTEDGYSLFTVVGRMPDTEIADYIIIAMQNQIRSLAKDYAKKYKLRMNSIDVKSFLFSAAQAAVEKYEEQLKKPIKESSTGTSIVPLDQALVKYEETKEWYTKNIGVQLISSSIRGSLNSAGTEAGRGVNINPGVRGGSSSQALLGR